MGLLEVLFPPRCAGCARGPWPFCGRCLADLAPLSPPWCRRCGLPLQADVERCPRCPPPPLAGARAAFAYEGAARAAVHRLKFSGQRRVGEALAPAMALKHPLAPLAPFLAWLIPRFPGPDSIQDPELKRQNPNYPYFPTRALLQLLALRGCRKSPPRPATRP